MSRFPHVLEQAKRRESKACFLLSVLLVVIGSLRYPQTMGGELQVVCGIIICVYFCFLLLLGARGALREVSRLLAFCFLFDSALSAPTQVESCFI